MPRSFAGGRVVRSIGPSWRLLVSTSLLPSAGVALGQHAPSIWWVVGVTALLSIANLWLWRSDMRAVDSRSYTKGWHDGHRKALHDSVYALRRTFGDGQ